MIEFDAFVFWVAVAYLVLVVFYLALMIRRMPDDTGIGERDDLPKGKRTYDWDTSR